MRGEIIKKAIFYHPFFVIFGIHLQWVVFQFNEGSGKKRPFVDGSRIFKSNKVKTSNDTARYFCSDSHPVNA